MSPFIASMIGWLGFLLLSTEVPVKSEPEGVSGDWVSEDWGTVALSMSEAGRYRGTFVVGSQNVSGSFDLVWSETERCYSGRWQAEDNCSGRITLQPRAGALEGAWTANKAAQRILRLPPLKVFSWTHADSEPAANVQKTEVPGKQEAEWLATTESVQVAFGGKSIDQWLEAFEETTIAETEIEDAGPVAISSFEAIEYFRARPQYDTEIRTQVAKWLEMAKLTNDRRQLKRISLAIARVSGPRHQDEAIDHLIQIAIQHPEESYRKFFETFSDDDSILIEPFSVLELNSELASSVSKSLREGNSGERFITLILFCGVQRNANDIRFWIQRNYEVLVPALLVASSDENEVVRRYCLNFCSEMPDPRIAARLMEVAESDSSDSNRGAVAQWLLHHQEVTAEVMACITKLILSDPSSDVKAEAISHLTLTQPEHELIHDTLMKWARSDDTQMMLTAIQMMQQHPAEIRRPMAIDELESLLSDREWGLQAHTNLFDMNDHFESVRQYAIARLGSFEHHAVRALPLLEKEKNPETIRFARFAIDKIQGYCSDLPVETLQGKWHFEDGTFPNDKPLFLSLKSAAEKDQSMILDIVGTELRIHGECVGYLYKARSNPEETLFVLIGTDSHQQRLISSIELDEDSNAARTRLFSIRLVDQPAGFEAGQREEIYRFRRVRAK